MTDSRKLPVGSVVRRADGSEWRKDEHGQDFTQLKAKDVNAAPKMPQMLASHTPPPAHEGWQAVRKAMKLDGHLPDDTIHPAHVQFDLEGDTDTKPVLTWHDNAGRRRHSYTEEFHRQRALHLKDEVSKAKDNLEAAHVMLNMGLRATSGTDTGDAYAAAIAHLETGHRIRDLLKMKGAHVSIPGGVDIEPSRGCDCPGCEDCDEWHPEEEDDTGEELEKALWSTAKVNDLPDSAFLYIEPGGEKDDENKTKPRSLRHLPYRDENGKVDLPHLRNALARLDGTNIPDSVKSGIRARAEKLLKRAKEKKIEKAERKGIPDAYNKPRRIRQGEPGYGKKKFVVNARNAQGKTRVIRFGDANLEIKRDDPKRRANFRARHNCASAKDRLSAKYWSCRQWRHKAKVEASISGGDDIQKSWRSSPHPDRVHLMMAHPAGHMFQSEIVNSHFADHLVMRDHNDMDPLFRTTEKKVRKALKKAGAHEVPEHVVRHHAVTKMASDILSKMPEVDLSVPGNLDVVKAHIMKASDEIGKRFGHGSAPSGMSHVPPHVAAAYIHHSNGHALWPKVFNKMEKSWNSTVEDEASSNPATVTISESRATKATSSTQQTNLAKAKTATPSLQPLPTIRGRMWATVADEVEQELNRAYNVRLAPSADDKAPRYFNDIVEVTPEDIVKGVKFTFFGRTHEVLECGEYPALKTPDGIVYPSTADIAEAISSGLANDDIYKAPRMRPVMEMDPQTLIDTKLVPKKRNTKEERAKRGYINRAVKLLKMARKGDSVALKELQGVVGMMIAHPMEQSFRTDTVSVQKGARGPSGDPIGTIKTHADGSKWEKREDGWHELGQDKRKKPEEEAKEGPTRSIGHQQALRALGKLRQQISQTADERERARLKQQIAIVRRRIAVFQRDEEAGQEKRGPQQKVKEPVEKSFALDMHRHLHTVIAKSKAMTPHEAIAEIVMGDDNLAQAEVRSLKAMVGDGIMDVIKTWMRG